MDPNKEPIRMPNSANAERDSETNQKSQSTPREVQAGQGDMNARILDWPQVPCQNTSNQRQRELQPHCSDARPGSSSEPALETHSGAGSSTQSSSIGKLNSNGLDDSAIPSSSKCSLNTSNGLGSPLSIYKLEVDKDGFGHIKLQPYMRESIDETKNTRENRKRPSSLQLNRSNKGDDSSSLSDYSLGSEDGCIYTYRGGEHLADLPSSFFSLDMGLPADRLALPNYAGPQAAGNAREGGSRASSPDMDFLEMDFDPGPSNEGDSGEESAPNADLEAAMEMPEEPEPVRVPTPVEPDTCAKTISVDAGGSHSDAHFNKPSTSGGISSSQSMPSTSKGVSSSDHIEPPEQVPQVVYGPYITHVNARGETIMVRRTMTRWIDHVSYHIFGEDLIPRLSTAESSHPNLPWSELKGTFSNADLNLLVPALMYNTYKTNANEPFHFGGHIFNYPMSNPLPCAASASCVEPPKSMIWSEEVVCERQVTQISASACGATAVINAFNALGVPVDMELINISVNTRLRANNATIPSYLLSRAVAGCTAADIINGIQIASGGLATARFFRTYPERAFSLSHFLSDWITLGAVPILTLNLQNSINTLLPDAWHHQMVVGVSTNGIYLCNPVECLQENFLWTRLVTPSVLLVRAKDVVSRFTEDTDLTPLMYVPDARFHTFNVFGQVANLLRESRLPWRQDSNPRTNYIRIPAAYQTGITIAVLTGSEAHQRLMAATHLPLLDSRRSDSPQDDPV